MGHMAKNRQKFLMLIILSVLSLSLISCDKLLEDHKTTTIDEELKYNIEDSVGDKSARILKYLGEDDKESLRAMFSPYQKRRKRLNKEIDKTMDFFEGKVLEYSSNVDGGDELAIDNGKTTLFSKDIYIKDIKTDAGKIYEIHGLYYKVNDNDPESIGLTYIIIYDITGGDSIKDPPSVRIGRTKTE